MKLLVLLMVASAASASSNFTAQKYKIRYDIYNQVSGAPIDHDYPAYIEISTTPDGDLRVDVGARFFNSPNQAESIRGKCPANPYYHYDIYEYNEVIELFFAANGTRYLQLDISPRGQYVVNLLDGKESYALNQLSLAPFGVEVHNPCFVDGVVQKDCRHPWTATAVIPRFYLPANLTKFNAHFLHGKVWGEVTPAKENYSVESLYPSLDLKTLVGRSGEQDRHYFGAFHDIDLASIGYVQQTEYSDFWKNATEHKDFVFTYNVSYTNDCQQQIVSPDYKGEVVVRKSKEFKKVFFYLKFSDKNGLKPLIPEPLRVAGHNPALNFDSESVWFNYRGENNESVRFGVNPYGAFFVQFRDDNKDLLIDATQLLLNVNFTQGTDANFEGSFELPWAFLPPVVSSFQVIHFHRPLAEAVDAKAAVASRFDFVGAVCPGFKVDQVDWRGCGFDYKAVVDKEDNLAYSKVWEEAINKVKKE